MKAQFLTSFDRIMQEPSVRRLDVHGDWLPILAIRGASPAPTNDLRRILLPPQHLRFHGENLQVHLGHPVQVVG